MIFKGTKQMVLVKLRKASALFAKLAILASVVASLPAEAASFSFKGTFLNDTDVQFFTFTLGANTPGVTLRTYSYGGGVNAANETIAAGGFDTRISVFMANGNAMSPAVVGSCTGTPLTADPVTGLCGDVYYPTSLSFPGGVWSAGTYTVALSLDANPAIGNLSDGFFANAVLGLTSPSNFTCQPGPTGFQGTPTTIPVDAPFCDSVATPTVQRTGNWALDILNVDSAAALGATPEPGAVGLVARGLLAIGAMRRKWTGR